MARNEQLNKLIEERIDIANDIKQKQSELSEINQELMKVMEENGTDRYDTLSGSATVVKPGKKTSYDWDKLRQAIGQIQWRTIVNEVPSEELLERAVAEGRISVDTLGKCIVENAGGKPYIRVAQGKR